MENKRDTCFLQFGIILIFIIFSYIRKRIVILKLRHTGQAGRDLNSKDIGSYDR